MIAPGCVNVHLTYAEVADKAVEIALAIMDNVEKRFPYEHVIPMPPPPTAIPGPGVRGG